MRIGVVLVLLFISSVAHGDTDTPVKRILIVGDSWAASISSENRDGFPSPDIFDELLVANGLGRYETQGAVTAWSGRKASDWAKPEHLAEIVAELNRYPDIDMVHLMLGGNDFLAAVHREQFQHATPEDRALIWNKTAHNLQQIVDTCLGVRKEIRVVIADYDYLDYDGAEKFWRKSFHGVPVATLNSWFRELGDVKRALAEATPRCEYLGNWGLLQYWFGTPEKSVPLPGGDPSAPMPKGISPDGIHPNREAHEKLLQHAIDQYYADWLRAKP